MKKTIIILILALAALFITLSLLGSKGEYGAERLLFGAMSIGEKIAANPDVVPPKLSEQVENKLKKLLQKYPDTETAKAASIKLGEFYIASKRYDDVLKQADVIIKKYEKNSGMLSMAHFLKGLAYEYQDRWPNALDEYKVVRDKYRDTQLGMQMPIYIAGYYSKKGRDSEAQEAYGEAERFYGDIEKENSGKPLGYMASLFLIQTYIKGGKFEEAATVVEESLNKYDNQMALVQLVPLVENIIVTKLGRPEKAIEIYKNIMERSKEDRLKKVLENRIEALSKPAK